MAAKNEASKRPKRKDTWDWLAGLPGRTLVNLESKAEFLRDKLQAIQVEIWKRRRAWGAGNAKWRRAVGSWRALRA